MTKDIMVSVAGIQYEIDPTEPVELITTGNYYNKNGKHYIVYDETTDEKEIVKNRIKISDQKVELQKSGATQTNMIFEKGKNNITYYDTPFGTLLMGITTNSLQVTEQEHEMTVKMQYSLEVNYSHVSDCDITIHVKSRA